MLFVPSTCFGELNYDDLNDADDDYYCYVKSA